MTIASPESCTIPSVACDCLPPVHAADLFHQDAVAPASVDLIPRNKVTFSEEGILLPDYDPPRIEFSVQPITLSEARFRHSGWALNRRRVWECLKRTGAGAARLDHFANCGSGGYVQVSPSTMECRYVANYCHDRMCVACGTARAAQVAKALVSALPKGPMLFVTLTLRHSPTPLSAQLDRLYDSFRKLRRRKDWLAAVGGGAAFLECKLSERDGMWHPHLHLLVSGRYLEAKALSRWWHEITGDSSIVDVRKVTDREGVSGYVAKYASKPVEGEVYRNSERLDECCRAMRGRRLCFTFGDWRGIDLDAKRADPGDWKTVGSLSELFADAEAGDTDARLILEALLNHDKWPLPLGPPSSTGPITPQEIVKHTAPPVLLHTNEYLP